MDHPSVDRQYSLQGRSERLIAILRVVLAGSSLFAIWLDPTQPAKYEAVTYSLLCLYLGYSVLLAVIVVGSEIPLPWMRVGTHAIDLVVFSFFIYLTEGPPVSPFFVYFVFSLICGALRWQLRGTVATAVISLALFFGMGFYQAEYAKDEKLNRFVIRGVYLAIVATSLGYMAVCELQTRAEISKLAGRPRTDSDKLENVAGAAMAHAANVLNAPRAVMVWEESEEPWRHWATWTAGHVSYRRLAPDDQTPLVDPALHETSFLCFDARHASPTALYVTPDGFGRWHGAPIDADLCARFGIGSVLSLRLRGEEWEGRLFLLDNTRMTSDELVIGAVVTAQVVATIDHFYLVQRLQQSAALRERVRLARDLHDGLLQSFTGMALQIETARRLLEDAPSAARDHLGEIREAMLAEQRNLRAFIRELKPFTPAMLQSGAEIVAAVQGVAGRFERQWGVSVDVSIGVLPDDIPAPLAREVIHLVHEALVNAARHGGASLVRLTLGGDRDEVVVSVVDDGRGFSFTGRYNLPALTAMNVGPASLKERVATLHGDLIIESGANGSRVEIRVPVSAAVA